MLKYFLSLFALIMLSGCVTETHQENSTISLVTTGNINHVIAKRIFFSWHPDINANYLNKERVENDAENKFTLALKSQLKRKGFIYTDDRQKADFYVGYGLGVDSQISDTKIMDKTGLLTGITPHNSKEANQDKASVFIAIYLPSQQVPQWTTLAQGYTDDKYKQQESFNQLAEFMLHSLD